MRIKLDNTDRDGLCLLTTWDLERGRHADDPRLDWERGEGGVQAGFGYAIMRDHAGLVDELVAMGYEVNGDDYARPDSEEELPLERFEDQVSIDLQCVGCGSALILTGNLSLREAGGGSTRLAYECPKCRRRVAVEDDWGGTDPAAQDSTP